MKTIENIIENNNASQTNWDLVNKILKQTGWPKLEEGDEENQMVSWDEDTKIVFELDEDDNKPYIKKIICNFVNMNPIHNRDLNGLVDLYDKLWKCYVHEMK